MALLVKGTKVLDVGCSDLPNKYIKTSYLVGFDLNTAILPENYVKHVVGNVYDLPNPFYNERFDTIIIGEVLEHVENPLLFLKKCTSILNKPGRLVLSTPNPMSFYEIFFNVFNNRKYMFSSDHITLYPQRYLVRMVENAGFNNVQLYSGGLNLPFTGKGVDFPWFGLAPFPRAFCYQTIVVGEWQ
jgi:ubiquinone/menaquinone biosynthesis C-methylase UbiE